MPLGDWFSTFCGNLIIRDSGTIATRSQNIVKRLNRDFRNIDSATSWRLYVGSYGRNTGIKLRSDVDLLYEMPYLEYKKYDAYERNGQSAFLQAVKTSIAMTYPTTRMSGDGQVCQIAFGDGISFDVLPAFLNKDGSYTFANTNAGGSWKNTDPKPEIEAIRSRNTTCNGNLVALCRMARAWKAKWSVPIGGLLIDTLAYQFIENWSYTDKSYSYYDYISRDFFGWLSAQNISQTYWKAPGSGQHVYADCAFQYKAKQCYNLAVSAITLELATPKKEWSAKQKWREIYGNDFPE